MKVIKAKIKVTQETGSTRYHYPQVWLDNKERIPAIFYPNDRSDQLIEDGFDYQIVYPLVPEDVYDLLIKLPEFSEADQAEFEAYTDKHNPQKEIILDQTAVLSVLAKSIRGEELSEKEAKIINPEHPEVGINLSKRSIEIVNEYGATF